MSVRDSFGYGRPWTFRLSDGAVTIPRVVVAVVGQHDDRKSVARVQLSAPALTLRQADAGPL